MTSRSQANKNHITAEDIVANHSPEVRRLVERLRTLITETVPPATEHPYPVWHSIGYRHPQQGYFCGIFPQQDQVKVGFEYGLLLPDPEGLLQGSGKRVRYMHVLNLGELKEDALKALLLAAINLPKLSTSRA